MFICPRYLLNVFIVPKTVLFWHMSESKNWQYMESPNGIKEKQAQESLAAVLSLIALSLLELMIA